MVRGIVSMSVFVLGALLLGRGDASAQGPSCPEFPVAAGLPDPTGTEIAAEADGGFVVVWTEYQPGNSDVVARRFDSGGMPRGPQFLVNTFTTGFQFSPSVAADPRGGFVVAWVDFFQGTVLMRRFDAAGVPVGGEVPVDTSATDREQGTAVAFQPDGSLMVGWQVDDGGTRRLRGRMFDPAGTPRTDPFQIMAPPGGLPPFLSLAAGAGGSFIAAASTYSGDPNFWDIIAQRVDANGALLGGLFPVNTYLPGIQYVSGIGSDARGNFVVVWDGPSPSPGSASDIYARWFDSSGAPTSPEVTVNTYRTSNQWAPGVASDAAGNVMIAWGSWAQDGSEEGVFAQRFDASRARQGGEFQINTATLEYQRWPEVAALGNARFVTVWHDNGRDGLFGRVDCGKFYALAPCRVADTRGPAGPSGGPPLAANASRAFPVSRTCGIPNDAAAVAFNVTAVNATDAGNLRLYPAGQLLPLASTVNFVAGATRANNAIVSLGMDGQVSVQCDMAPGSSGNAHLVLDAFGYFKP